MSVNKMVRAKYKMTPATAAPMITYLPGRGNSKTLHICCEFIIEGVLTNYNDVMDIAMHET